ncbi:histidine phosphatase family protein [Halomonas elongata]|uniref:Histidine phosphatase family protein n=1 Tax=Halomonas elongata (strain ATCC 33173 / DSM 2581 / NBRC 15536 / NCIMB 2198 / 1H9) TaxID=768066 RepID=E1V4F0_HALED|nr:histidine phosphatase family protein [Halomonas elongata]WBF16633.1 histidine phosphatase family protein [Halomonas elongata]WPU49074.1 histidine phosphatase family protein [Halomonas elongata DSM 2581]CBV42888.2 homolog to phosphoglycerate mutase [Halomonas elongata DSM 2581]
MSNTLPLDLPNRRNRYLVMRHGHSEANRQGRIISSPVQGIASFGLSARGRAEVSEVLSAWRWPRPTRIVHSDFLRTTQTAMRVAEHFGIATSVDAGLREREFGELEGGEDARYADVWAWDAVDAGHERFGVEPVDAVAERMIAVLQGLEEGYEGEVVLLVSHGDPLQILLSALAGVDLRHHRDRPPLQPAEVVVLSE